MKWLEVIYKCRCLDRETTLQMPERGDDEDIADFMKRLQIALGADHSDKSPHCQSPKVEYVKIYLPQGDTAIGKAAGSQA